MTHPLSQAQMGIYLTCMNYEGEGNYNNAVLYRLDAQVDLTRLKKAIGALVEAHPYVLSRLVIDESGEVAMEEHTEEKYEVKVEEVDDIEQVRASLLRNFDLLHERLFRMEIYKTKRGNYLYVNLHHIISDGFSFVTIREDLQKAYAGERLEKEVVDGNAIAEQEKALRESEQMEVDRQWYLKEFGEANELDSMPQADVYDQTEEHFAREYIPLHIDRAALKALAEKAGVTESMVFTGALGLTLAKFTGDDSAAFTTIYHGRHDKRTHRALTMMVHTLPAYVQWDGETTVVDYLQKLQSQQRQARLHNAYSFADLHSEMGWQSEVSFAYQGEFHTLDLVLDGRIQGREELITNTPGIKLLCMVMIEKGEYYAWCEYPTNRYSKQLITEFWESYMHILTQMTCVDKVSEVEVCSSTQLTLLDSFNAHSWKATDDGETVLSWFKKTAAAYPDNTAVVFKDHRYSYKELNALTDRIGAAIYERVKDCGKKEPVVSILIPRSEYMALLPLASIKAGCAYQPLDPSYPKERLNFMVKDADAALLIADSDLRDIVDEYNGEVILLQDVMSLQPKVQLPVSPLTPNSLFILLYTSGSTGVPKGVMIEHGNIMAFCKCHRQVMELTPESKVAAYASFGFDANIADTYPILVSGGTLHIIAEELRLNLVELGDYFNSNGITHAIITTQVGVQFLQNVEATTLKHMLVGGEKLVSVEPRKEYHLHNAYGPTECTVYATQFEVEHSEANIPVGKSVGATKCYVMDKWGHRLPVGAAGELIIVGNQVARGYLNRPDKTAEAFFTMNGERAYHSGDIVRYRADGNIEFVGRKDGQVKVRGFRIELKEVEAVIRDFEGVKDVTVQAFDAPSGGKAIAAYVVGDAPIDVAALNAFIAEQKPPYMVPAVTMQIERIPLNVNQKVDKKALPKPEVQSKTISAENVPLNALEKDIMQLVAPIIGVDEVPVTEPLIFYGLSSIAGLKLAAQLHKKYGVSPDMHSFVKSATLQSIENMVLERWMNGEVEQTAQASEQVTHELNFADGINAEMLTYQQTGVYFDSLKNPEGLQYNIPILWTMPEGVTVDAVEQAVKAVLEAHHLSTDNVQTKTVSLEELEHLKQTFVQPFDLSKGTPYRICIASLSSAPHRVYLFSDFHHVIFDGASYDIFMSQLTAVLRGEAIEQEEYSYRQYALDQKQYEQSEEFQQAKAFFGGQMANYESAQQLIPDVYGEDNTPHREAIYAKRVGVKVSDFCKKNGLSEASFYLAATYLTCHAFSGNKDVYVCTISNGRSNLQTTNTFGMFVNTLVLAGHIGDGAVVDFLRKCDDDFQTTLQHENYPYSRLATEYGLEAQVVMVYEVGVISDYQVGAKSVTKEELSLNAPKFPLAVLIEGNETEQYIRLHYDDALFSEGLMREFADTMNCVVEQLLEKNTIADICWTSNEQEQLLDSFNHYTPCTATDETVVSLFRKQALLTPNNTAVIYDEKRWTYHELDVLTDRIAQIITSRLTLREGQDNIVSILINRSEWMVLASLSVLKSGCAYQPLDPSYPEERLNFMIKDSQAQLLLAHRELRPILTDYTGEVLYIEDLLQMVDNGDAKGVKITAPSPLSLFTLLYTSGSTGTPKGAMVEHRNLVSFCLWSHKHMHITTESVSGAFSSYGFDPNMSEMYPALTAGASVCIVPEDIRRDLQLLHDYYEKHHVTHSVFTTQMGVLFVKNFPTMRYMQCISMGGEKMPSIEPPSYAIYNCYGPTECTIQCTAYHVQKKENNIPIGDAMENAHIYIVDSQLRRVPVGAIGELLIAGDGVGPGYLNLPEKTTQAFINWRGIRAYRTGDIVRWRQDGMIEFVGRRDGQVKIRGFRVELKEVEAIIRDYKPSTESALINDCTVQAFENPAAGGKFIAAYVVGKGAINIQDLTHFIADRKPQYMVPACIMQIDAIPLNVNQKVDKKRLPTPVISSDSTYVEPTTEKEKVLCTIFADILNVEKIGATDNFFEMGGSSLIVTQVILAAQKQGINIAYADVFAHPTARELAAMVGEDVANDAAEHDFENYDYTKINDLLTKNTLAAYLASNESFSLGNVLLLGATGFLGIHILHELLENYPNTHIYCLLRGKRGVAPEERLKQLLYYYFEKNYTDLFGNRIVVVEGDVSQPLQPQLEGVRISFTSVINCAAIVKHFAKGTEIEDFNVGSVKNCVDYSLLSGARLIHISTTSVAGMEVAGETPHQPYSEQQLWINQYAHNQYIHSKLMGERIILEAVAEKGLDAKIMRVGNLSARACDGEFQANAATNSFMGRMRVYKMLQAFPYSSFEAPTEFSPIDELASAICLLAQTPRACCLFHPFNSHYQLLGDVVERLGVRLVENDEFESLLQQAGKDPEKAQRLSALLAYQESDEAVHYVPILSTNSYTTQVLLRKGFEWSKVSSDYVDQFVRQLADLGYFDN